MRVISGSARGLKLKAPEGLDTRPTIDRIKESLFNIIANDLYDIDFLDVYSGSGGIGIEALSRGARSAVFIDSAKKSIDVIEKNLKSSRLSDSATVLKSDVFDAILKLGRENKKFDIIFMDPPYKKGLVEETLEAIKNSKILADDGFIIAEQSSDEKEIDVDGFNVYRVKKYNKIKMTFLENDCSEVLSDE